MSLEEHFQNRGERQEQRLKRLSNMQNKHQFAKRKAPTPPLSPSSTVSFETEELPVGATAQSIHYEEEMRRKQRRATPKPVKINNGNESKSILKPQNSNEGGTGFGGARPKTKAQVKISNELSIHYGSQEAEIVRNDDLIADDDDLTFIAKLDEDTIVKILHERFAKNKIYTYISDVIIAVNPYKYIPNLYSGEDHNRYLEYKSRRTFDPHVYWTALRAYHQMCNNQAVQAILVSGESGSGKTETTKHIIEHLTFLGGGEADEMDIKINRSNPLLEAFGNASTELNKNSSRFGKFMELTFTSEGNIVGAQVSEYVLEKSRVVHQSLDANDRNFHIFYYLFAGMPENDLRYYYLEKPEDHRILSENKSSVYASTAHKDECYQSFQQLTRVFDDWFLDEDEQVAIWTFLSAILHITNVRFIEEKDELSIVDSNPVKIVADLLKLDVEELESSLTSTVLSVNDERVSRSHTKIQAEDVRDAIGKELYARLFGWIVLKINDSLKPLDLSRLSHSLSVGILDLSGFENLQGTYSKNSFEQLCINIANEQLQFYFNKHVFQDEQEQYAREGIQWTDIKFENNEALMKLFTDKIGMLSLIDEESKFPTATDQSLVEKMTNNFKRHKHFHHTDMMDPLQFGVKHYAGEVMYVAEKFLEKNQDNFSTDATKCLRNSKMEFLSDLFAHDLSVGNISRSKLSQRGRPSNRKHGIKIQSNRLGVGQDVTTTSQSRTTMCTYFKKSLQEMMAKMKKSPYPLFVRCIKPNVEQQPDKFDDEYVLRQLRYTGVLSISKIRRLGFPVRMDFRNFVEKYRLLSPTLQDDVIALGTSEACLEILQSFARPSEYAIGKRKVFMKNHIMDKLNKEMEGKAAELLQEAARKFLARIADRRLKQARDDVMSLSTDSTLDKKEASSNTKFTQTSDTETEDDIVEDEDEPIIEDDGSVIEGIIEEKGARKPWDQSEIVPREMPSVHEDYANVLRFLRILVYFLIIMVNWVCATLSQLSLLLLLAGYGITQALVENVSTDDLAYINIHASYKFVLSQLIAILCLPQILTVVINGFKALFSNMPLPSARFCFAMVVINLLATIGELILVLHVLPFFSTIISFTIIFAVGVIPAIFRCCFTIRLGTSKAVTALLSMGDVIALILQAAAVVFPLIFMWLASDMKYLSNTTQTSVTIVHLNRLYWQTPLALILTSLRWWENFIDKDLGPVKMISLKKNSEAHRLKVSVITSLINFLCLIGYYLIYEYSNGRSVEIHSLRLIDHVGFSKAEEVVATIGPGAVQIVASFLVYYFSGVAIKLMMQRAAFVLPLYLSILTVPIIISLQCHGHIAFPEEYLTYFGFQFICDSEVEKWYWAISCVVLILSLLWVARHILVYKNDRLVSTEHLFVTPFYINSLLIPGIFLNRKLHDKKITQNSEGKYEEMDYESHFDPRWQSPNYWYDWAGSAAKPSRNTKSRAKSKTCDEDDLPPKVLACATMWHETVQEMTQLMKSIFRMDQDQAARKFAMQKFKIDDPDYYEFETHIFFDDAMELSDDNKWFCNSYVKDMIKNIDIAASAILQREYEMPPPVKVPTPYGGRLIWKLPGGNELVVHLKDKNKIRHKKRWSQVMYMYYLLGYKIMYLQSQQATLALKDEERRRKQDQNDTSANDVIKKTWIQRQVKRAFNSAYGAGEIFNLLEESVIKQLKNTFVLALDGDVDFSADAVRILVDSMKRSTKTGAACGRIHPIGSGPMIWYQQFEYAIGHWFQKATEHMFGCVLCSPGCFSLFRGSCLIDDNVMKRYATVSTEASHFLQYDQGEDRWLCTLLLQQGYRVDYAAAADALTFAPEGFNEFFNQRRRWVTSTLANQMDLLSDFKNTVRVNDNISMLFMVYQLMITVSTILGPATIVLAIASALETVIGTELWVAYLLATAPPAIYIFICFYCKPANQLYAGAILSAVYAGIMLFVLVGIISEFANVGDVLVDETGTAVVDSNGNIITEANLLDPSLFFIVFVTACFIFAGIVHPYEFWCLAPGVLYFLCVPAGYLILIIYAFANMQVVSWGTREAPKKLTKEQLAEQKKAEEEKARKKAKSGFFNFLNLDSLFKEFAKTITDTFKSQKADVDSEQLYLLRQIVENMNYHLRGEVPPQLAPYGTATAEVDTTLEKKKKKVPAISIQAPIVEEEPEDLEDPHWFHDPDVEHMEIQYIDPNEWQFWEDFIFKYEQPLKKNKTKEKKLSASLIELRNNANFAIWFSNGLWILFNYLVQINGEINSLSLTENIKVQPIGFIFLIVFVIVLVCQMIGMIAHRWNTFMQLIAITHLPSLRKRITNKINHSDIINYAKELTKAPPEPPPDYDGASITTNQQEYLNQEQLRQQVLMFKQNPQLFLQRNNRYHGYNPGNGMNNIGTTGGMNRHHIDPEQGYQMQSNAMYDNHRRQQEMYAIRLRGTVGRSLKQTMKGGRRPRLGYNNWQGQHQVPGRHRTRLPRQKLSPSPTFNQLSPKYQSQNVFSPNPSSFGAYSIQPNLRNRRSPHIQQGNWSSAQLMNSQQWYTSEAYKRQQMRNRQQFGNLLERNFRQNLNFMQK